MSTPPNGALGFALPPHDTSFRRSVYVGAPDAPAGLRALRWLGYGVNMLDPQRRTDASAVDFADRFKPSSILDNLLMHRRITELSSMHDLTVVGRNGRTPIYCFSLPSNIVVYDDVGDSDACLRIFPSGQEVCRALQFDNAFAGTYMGFTVSGSGGCLLGGSYQCGKQYAFINQSQALYTAAFDESALSLNNDAKDAATSLPHWDPQSSDLVRKYYTHFQSYGTHLVMKVTYGRRYQIMISADNSSDEQRQKFGAHVKAQYLEGPLQDRNTQSTSYEHYQCSSQWHINVNGGDKTKAEHWKAHPEDGEKRCNWLDTWGLEPNDDIIKVKIQEIGILYAQNADPNLQKAGENLKAALSHFLTVQRSYCWIFVDSDYGWIEIMSQNARIEVPEKLPHRVEPGSMNEKYVRFGKPRESGRGGQGTFRDSMPFTIVGDGSPIDVVLGTGDAGSGGGGTAKITLKICNGGYAEKLGPGCKPVFGLAVSSLVEYAI